VRLWASGLSNRVSLIPSNPSCVPAIRRTQRIARKRGHLVNIASVAGLAPYPLALPYTTARHAVVGLSQGLRAEARE